MREQITYSSNSTIGSLSDQWITIKAFCYTYSMRENKIVLLIIIILILAVPLTVFISQKQQNVEQHAAGGYFSTLPPGSTLPSESDCAAMVRRNAWEPRHQNDTANQTNVYSQGFRLTNSAIGDYDKAMESRVTGNFTGTTDEIFQWAACKWGFDEDSVRAQAVKETNWDQTALGDCGFTTQPQTHGCASVGILQVKGADIPPTHPGTWPAAWTSTAFSVDYTLGMRRLCFEGKELYLHDRSSSYAAGDMWGCIGRWYSGSWHDSGADAYIAVIKDNYNIKPWIAWGYPGTGGATITSGVTTTITPTTSNTNGITFITTICPHGLGNCGDNVSAQGGNINLQHTTRTITFTIMNASNQPVKTAQGILTYNQTTKNFQGNISVGTIASGNYLASAKIDGFLGTKIPGIIAITPNKQITLTPLSMANGDINNDNQLDISDYNLLVSCFGTKANTSSCQNKNVTDINDDGKTDAIDYNLFLRELSVQKGQ